MLKLLLCAVLTGCAILVACGSNSPSPSDTWMIDCVSVLGTPPPSAQMPLAAVPLSGLPRESLIGNLTDEQLGQFADYLACLSANGYRHDCCTNTQCPYTVPSDPPIGPFRLETVPLIAAEVDTCYSTTFGESAWPSREQVASLYSDTFANCHVGLFEDCARERISAPFGDSVDGPDCTEVNDLCGAIQ